MPARLRASDDSESLREFVGPYGRDDLSVAHLRTGHAGAPEGAAMEGGATSQGVRCERCNHSIWVRRGWPRVAEGDLCVPASAVLLLT